MCKAKSFGANSIPVIPSLLPKSERFWALWVCLDILCVGMWVGGLDWWVISDKRALENIKGSITTVKIKLGTACPDLQPRSDQIWPWQRWIIRWGWIQELLVNVFGPCGHLSLSLSLFQDIIKNYWVGFWPGKRLQQIVEFQSPSKLFPDSSVLIILIFSFSGMYLLVSPVDIGYDFWFSSGNLLPLLEKFST